MPATFASIKGMRIASLLTKEATLGALNGIVTGAIAAGAMWFVVARSGDDNGAILGGITLAAMVISCTLAGLAGATIPLVLKRLGADPATASSIFLTTMTDVVGFFSFLGIASLWFGLK